MRTNTILNTRNPIWNQFLNFGFNYWFSTEIRLYDEDVTDFPPNPDDLLGGVGIITGFRSNYLNRNSTFCPEEEIFCSDAECATCNTTVDFSAGNIVSNGM